MEMQERMDRQLMTMQQSGSWSQPGPRDQFNDGQSDHDDDDETYNDENDC